VGQRLPHLLVPLKIFSPNWVKFPQQNTPGTYALFNA
jgi:hypothetical protein